jgi:hypothetical protein
LYVGLFTSPFILVFAVSVFYLNHGRLIVGWLPAQTYRDLRIPEGLDRLKGREAVERARDILPQVDVAGEIGFIRYVRTERHLTFPVSRAGVESMVDVNLDARSATVTRRTTSLWESLAYLHKMPGPHNVAIRGNWSGVRVWSWLADATIYLLIFISISGVYLWWVIRAERRIGLMLLTAGTATLLGLIYAIVR